MKKLAFSLSLILAINASVAMACTCVDLSYVEFADKVRWAVNNSDAVFLGTVDRFEWVKGVPNQYLEEQRKKDPGLTWDTRTAVFSVDRWWKGPVDAETLIYTEQTQNSDGTGSDSSCNYGFEQGKIYLVFAHRVDGYLKNSACSFTSSEEQAKETLKILGEGRKPNKPKN